MADARHATHRLRQLTGVFAVLACLLLVACLGPSPPATPTPTATPLPTSTPLPTPTATPAPPRPEANPFPPALRDQALAMLDRVAAIRGTPPLAEVDMFLLTRDQAGAYYGRDAPAGGGARPPRPLDSKQELYRLLGLIPERSDLRQQSLDNLITLILGFYSPELDALYLLEEITGGLDGVTARTTIVHELVHALQDQYHDLPALQAARADDWDATIALLDVMEGDAIAAEIAYFGFSTRASYRAPLCFGIPDPLQPGVPRIVERELDTQYEDGLCFVQVVAPRLPGGVAAIWNDLPTTTEHILHPEKYLAGEGARPVTLPLIDAALGAGWTRLAGHNFGEFTLQNLLLAGLAAERPLVLRAAAGWGGDAWALYTHDDARLLQSLIAWDDANEASEFWSAFQASLRNRGATFTSSAAAAFRAALDGRLWRAALAGDRVTLLVSTDPVALDAAATRLGLP